MLKILIVAGARPNFMKVAPLVHELAKREREGDGRVVWKLLHTGQHYDYEMSKVFFEDLDMPKPDYFLGVGSGTHAAQTAKIMTEFEKICLIEKPDVTVVVGDVNSTLACSVTAKKLNMKVAHVEAGLRSRDMSMPEEINRIVTDSISDYLFVTERSGLDNLMSEGKTEEKIFFVGNIMIDTLHYCLNKLSLEGTTQSAKQRKVTDDHYAPGTMRHAGSYAVVTLHRPSNVDDRERLGDILRAIRKVSEDMTVYFPMHPRTNKNMEGFGLESLLKGANIVSMPPMSYLEFLALWKDSSLVLTDSGGIQEETTALGIPCITVRENTERPVTIEEGTNILAGITSSGILRAYADFKNGARKKGRIPELWDGRAAQRIVEVLLHDAVTIER